MRRGDLVTYDGHYWLVQAYDAKRLRVAHLLRADGAQVEIPHDLDLDPSVLIVAANPSADWPFLTTPEKTRWGKVTGVSRVRRSGLQRLVPFAEWIFADPVRMGGSLFLHPGLVLRIGENIQITYEKGATNVSITPSFGTVASKQARVAVKEPPKEVTVYDRLLQDEDIE